MFALIRSLTRPIPRTPAAQAADADRNPASALFERANASAGRDPQDALASRAAARAWLSVVR